MRVDPAGNLLALIDKDKQNNKQIGQRWFVFLVLHNASTILARIHRASFNISNPSDKFFKNPDPSYANRKSNALPKNLSVILSNSVSDPDNPLESRRLGKNPETGPEHFQNPKILE